MDVHRAVRYRTKRTSIHSSTVDANLPMTGAMLAANSTLAPATTYTVRVSGFVQATRAPSGSGSRPAPGRLPPPDAPSRKLAERGGHRKPALSMVVTVEEMPRPMRTRLSRRLQALLLVAVAIALVALEPFGKGDLLLQLTPTHGIDTTDLPALALLLVAACLAI